MHKDDQIMQNKKLKQVLNGQTGYYYRVAKPQLQKSDIGQFDMLYSFEKHSSFVGERIIYHSVFRACIRDNCPTTMFQFNY